MLKRKKYAMPDFIRLAIQRENLLREYESRPPYQRNDYIGWIVRAKQERTRHKRLNQMLSELRQGDVYMSMRWNPGRRANE